MAKHLHGIDFPARRDELMEHVRRHDPDQAVLDVLQRMPDWTYRSMSDVMKGMGQIRPD